MRDERSVKDLFGSYKYQNEYGRYLYGLYLEMCTLVRIVQVSRDVYTSCDCIEEKVNLK